MRRVSMRYGAQSTDKSVSASSAWTLIGTTNLTVSTTSTTATACGTITLSGIFTASKIIYVRIRDTAGPRDGYFFGSDCFFENYQDANGSTSTLTYGSRIIHRYSSGAYAQYPAATNGGYGVYAYSISSAGVLTFRRRYNSSYSLTIDGTYKCEIYTLTYPDNVSPFI